MRLAPLARTALACGLASLLALGAPGVARAAEAPATYTLRHGDAVTIRIVGNDGLETLAQPIRPDGRITMPLVGEVAAGGATVTELQRRLEKAYVRIVRDPRVVVTVATFRPLRVNVIGLVNKPGTYQVPEPVKLLEALALAGGLDRDRAVRDAVIVLRADGSRSTVDLTKVLAGAAADDVVLRDGDTVQVDEVAGPDLYRIMPVTAAGLSMLASILVLVLR
jgi:polysaccharide export outer membrane protein